ncbi:DUF3300 domain-containing protein [Mangrovicoccus algicola]|uniref:DUF3300 domain-containing protein n=1 Tax=Mangrovicoccus algicola TaxID=2771008 RepID=A0A8J6YSC9_9RHOB|nr:DUF3300 domain-containing protein [Mangrovicoccus algicola]MBE3638343.1 DUF3300 domain-containing protein [Mangrovicoccus algicola]
MRRFGLTAISVLALAAPPGLYAQETATDAPAMNADPAAGTTDPADTAEGARQAATAESGEDAQATDSAADPLLSEAELEQLVAPVALYPDTLLIQILVAAASPLEVVKGAQFLENNADAAPETLKPQIEAEGWDPSVTVLATAFPTVLTEMADHIDWTEATGEAMLAQTDDVMTAVQVLRNQAVDSGALVSGEEQTVATDAADNVVIVPTDPEVVYVPQYQPTDIWGGVGGAVMTGAIAWGTFAVIDEIFDDDDDWDDYWGCRNCGGWGGGPVIRDPDIDIDVDGNVNIGNHIDIDRGSIRDRIDEAGDGGGIGWRPDPDRVDSARDKIGDKLNGGATTLPTERLPRHDGTGDALRARLSERSGAPDISAGAAAAAAVAAGAGAGALSRIDRPSKISPAQKRDAIARTHQAAPASRPAASRPAIHKPAEIHRPATGGAAAKKPVALKKKAAAPRAKAAMARGGKSAPKHKLTKKR